MNGPDWLRPLSHTAGNGQGILHISRGVSIVNTFVTKLTLAGYENVCREKLADDIACFGD